MSGSRLDPNRTMNAIATSSRCQGSSALRSTGSLSLGDGVVCLVAQLYNWRVRGRADPLDAPRVTELTTFQELRNT
ncbi:hypothetical protein GCM10019017_19790 [Streptomyces showdoensis]